MKRIFFVIMIAGVVAASCNNESETTNTTSSDTSTNVNTDIAGDTTNRGMADAASSDFLMHAAHANLAESEMGKLAQQKATNTQVKDFANMMVTDHTGANQQVQALAQRRNITLPTMPDSSKAKDKADLEKKSGADFDKAYMDLMVKEHEKAIDLFEKASKDVNDSEVKAFADNTLPKLKTHLETAKNVRKAIK